MNDKLNGIVMISYLEYPFPVGLSARITGLTNLLTKNGVKVKLLAPNTSREVKFHKKEYQRNFEIERINIKISRLRDSGKFSLRLLEWLMFSIIASFKVTKSYIKHNYLIQYQSFFSFIPALFAKVFLRAKIVGDDIVLFNNFIDILFLKFTDLVVTPSLRTFSLTSSMGKPSLYVPNGIERTLKQSNSKPNTTLLFVGALSFDQNLVAVKKIIKIAEVIEKKKIEFNVIIIGGPTSYVENLFSSEIIKKGKIKFLGNVSRKKLVELSKTSFIGLLPFFKDTPLKGGQRTKALEFFANGLLVISGPEGVKGINGLEPSKHYLLANSIEEMCTIIQESLLEPKKYLKVAEAGSKYVTENYSWEILTKEYVNHILTFVYTRNYEKY